MQGSCVYFNYDCLISGTTKIRYSRQRSKKPHSHSELECGPQSHRWRHYGTVLQSIQGISRKSLYAPFRHLNASLNTQHKNGSVNYESWFNPFWCNLVRAIYYIPKEMHNYLKNLRRRTVESTSLWRWSSAYVLDLYFYSKITIYILTKRFIYKTIRNSN